MESPRPLLFVVLFGSGAEMVLVAVSPTGWSETRWRFVVDAARVARLGMTLAIGAVL